MKVNGEMVYIQENCSLAAYLEKHGFQTARIAVERNGEIVPKAQYETCMLSDADTLEIVHFVGGG